MKKVFLKIAWKCSILFLVKVFRKHCTNGVVNMGFLFDTSLKTFKVLFTSSLDLIRGCMINKSFYEALFLAKKDD